jgi:hypothetical protein
VAIVRIVKNETGLAEMMYWAQIVFLLMRAFGFQPGAPRGSLYVAHLRVSAAAGFFFSFPSATYCRPGIGDKCAREIKHLHDLAAQ